MNTKKHDVPEELLSGLLANYKKPEDLIGENGLLKQLTKLLVERALDAELTEHLGHERNEAVANPAYSTPWRTRFQAEGGQVNRQIASKTVPARRGGRPMGDPVGHLTAGQ